MIFLYDYIPFNIWDILVLVLFVFIRHSILTGYSVFYLEILCLGHTDVQLFPGISLLFTPKVM